MAVPITPIGETLLKAIFLSLARGTHQHSEEPARKGQSREKNGNLNFLGWNVALFVKERGRHFYRPRSYFEPAQSALTAKMASPLLAASRLYCVHFLPSLLLRISRFLHRDESSSKFPRRDALGFQPCARLFSMRLRERVICRILRRTTRKDLTDRQLNGNQWKIIASFAPGGKATPVVVVI